MTSLQTSALRLKLGALRKKLFGAHRVPLSAFHRVMPAEGLFRYDELNWLATRSHLQDMDTAAFLNPPGAVQSRFVGNTYGQSYLEGAGFLDRVLRTARRFDEQLDFGRMRILDFGCGWGRMLRILARSSAFRGAELFGCDAMELALQICRRSVPSAFFSRTGVHPPSIYRDGLFDFVYAYSVFSHLSESAHLAWAAEFARIVRPGGFVAVTTQGRNFIQVCAEFRTGVRRRENVWHESLAEAFAEPDALARYDAGSMLFYPSGGGDELTSDFYGEAAVPREFFVRNWGSLGFELLDWCVPDEATSQTIAFLRRRS